MAKVPSYTETILESLLSRLRPRLSEGAAERIRAEVAREVKPFGDPIEPIVGLLDFLWSPAAASYWQPGKAPSADEPDKFRSVLALLPIASERVDELARSWRVELAGPDTDAQTGEVRGPASAGTLARRIFDRIDSMSHANQQWYLSGDHRPGLSSTAEVLKATLQHFKAHHNGDISAKVFTDEYLEHLARGMGHGKSRADVAKWVAWRLADPAGAKELTHSGQPRECDGTDPIFRSGVAMEGDAKYAEAYREAHGVAPLA